MWDLSQGLVRPMIPQEERKMNMIIEQIGSTYTQKGDYRVPRVILTIVPYRPIG